MAYFMSQEQMDAIKLALDRAEAKLIVGLTPERYKVVKEAINQAQNQLGWLDEVPTGYTGDF